ncbi:MAG: hypothetical protein WC300_00955, partial [Candidatus Omnitrophota bacterium]
TGLWIRYNNGALWKRIAADSAYEILASDIDADGKDDLVIDFGQDASSTKTGLWIRYNNGSWKWISKDSASGNNNTESPA